MAVEVNLRDQLSRTGWDLVVAGEARRLQVSEARALSVDLLPGALGTRSAVLWSGCPA